MIHARSCTISARRPAVHVTLQELPGTSLDAKLQVSCKQMWVWFERGGDEIPLPEGEMRRRIAFLAVGFLRQLFPCRRHRHR